MKQTTCRRCSECQGCDHHWMDNLDFEDENDDPEYVCKHCPAVGTDCQWCEEGIRNGKRCGICKGDGILQCGTKEIERQLLDKE